MSKGRATEKRDVVLRADIPESYRRVASQPGSPGSHHGRTPVLLAERPGRHLQQAIERGVGTFHVARQKLVVWLVRGRPSVGADILADITAEDPVAETRSEIARDSPALLDRLERDARRRVNRVGGDDRTGR